MNVGELTNKGFELSVYGTPYRTKDWNVDLRANIAWNKNTVKKLADGLDMLNHVSMAAALEKQENGERKLPESFCIMPAKYKQLVKYVQTCRQDADGRAAVRLKKQLKYLQEE